MLAIGSALAYLLFFRECTTPPHVQVWHTTRLSFSRPSPASVLQATNAGARRPGYEAISYQVTLTEGVWPRDTERSNCYDTETTYYKLCSVLTLTSRDPYTENNSLQISYPDVKRSLHWQSLTTNFLPWHQEIPIVMCWSLKNAAINWPYLQTRETCWPSVTMDYKCQDDLHQQDQLLQINSHEIKYHKINFLWEQLS